MIVLLSTNSIPHADNSEAQAKVFDDALIKDEELRKCGVAGKCARVRCPRYTRKVVEDRPYVFLECTNTVGHTMRGGEEGEHGGTITH